MSVSCWPELKSHKIKTGGGRGEVLSSFKCFVSLNYCDYCLYGRTEQDCCYRELDVEENASSCDCIGYTVFLREINKSDAARFNKH